jgi:hypothetical protein
MTWLTSTVMLSSSPGPSSTDQMDLIALYDLIDLKDLLMIWLATKPIPWFDSFQDLGPRIAYSVIWLISTPSDHKAHTMIWIMSNPAYHLVDAVAHLLSGWYYDPLYYPVEAPTLLSGGRPWPTLLSNKIFPLWRHFFLFTVCGVKNYLGKPGSGSALRLHSRSGFTMES